MRMSQPTITKLTFERNACPLGIGQSRPKISWRYAQDTSTVKDFKQKAYELRFERDGSSNTHKVESEGNVEVAWPEKEKDLSSRERVNVGVRACGEDGGWTQWFNTEVEAGLLSDKDWKAEMITSDITQPLSMTKRPIYLRSSFNLSDKNLQDFANHPPRIYATAFGVYSIFINGHRIGDHVLAPGWQAYQHILHYQTYAVPSDVLQAGENVIGIIVGEGWYAGRLTWNEGCRNYWGSEIGARCQLEAGDQTISTNTKDWTWTYGPLISSELYDGEYFDATLIDSSWSKAPLSKGESTRSLSIPKTIQLVAPEAPPIRRTEEVKPVELITTPKGAKIIDFGQNLVGWVKIKVVPKNKSRFPLAIVLRHAEVLDQGEIGIRPLRTAKASDKIFLSDKEVHNWEPEFTTHGFRYVEISGCEVDKDNFVAVVVRSDMERLGDFECSHEYINKLHSNVLWGFKGNFVGVPTDCPQRDERLGWTGDLQVVVPTASFLFDTSGMLANWLHGLKEEQLKDGKGVPPLVSPAVLDMQSDPKPFPQAVWCDVCTMGPLDLYHAFGSPQILEEMWESMSTWIDKGIPKGKDGLWDAPPGAFQLADWLDPKAPPDDAAAAVTDPFLVANEYLVRVTAIVAEVAKLLGKDAEHKKYKNQADARLKAFQNQYATPLGRLAGDTQTAYVLAIAFDLLSSEQMKEAASRLAHLCQKDQFRIGTGFAGTNSVLKSLVKTDQLQLAYRMLQEGKCPSWFYPITMGATTIWERWNSLLPDGSINPDEMTSFNHYAFGSVANFLHSTIAGLSPAQPGWKVVSIYPRPGGTVTSAKAHHITPYGKVACEWAIKDGKITLKAEVPPNTTAEVQVGKVKETVGSGYHEWTTKYEPEGVWPPVSYTGTSPEPRKQTFIP